MAKGKNQRLKLLYLSRLFSRETDEVNGLTMAEIIEKLSEEEIDASRKSIYEDIKALNDFGMDIKMDKDGNRSLYHEVSRDFDLAELKMLVDAVQSSRVITAKQSRDLIKKIEDNLCSKFEAKQLNRQVYVLNRIKSQNESLFLSVDAILTSISNNKKITFKYFMWDIKGEKVFRKDGALYKISPWALCWEDENYYLIAYDSEDEKIKYYRVDKMIQVKEIDEPRDGYEKYREIDLSTYTDKRFRMFDGKVKTVELIAKNHMSNVIFDTFGRDIFTRPYDEEHFKAGVEVAVTGQFYGWIFGLGEDVKIVGPKEVVEEYKFYLSKNIKNYK